MDFREDLLVKDVDRLDEEWVGNGVVDPHEESIRNFIMPEVSSLEGSHR